MKTLVKFFITVLLLVSCQPAFCQKLPSFHEWYTNKEIRKNYPEYTSYIEEYTSRLYDNLKIKENFPWYTTLGVNYYFTINKDGKVSDFQIYTACDEYLEYVNKFIHPIDYYSLITYSRKFEEYTKKIIYENPPKPFPKEIEYERMRIQLEITVEPKNTKDSNYQHKEFSNYINIDKTKTDICNFDIVGGNTTTHNPVKKTSFFVPPTWSVKIYKYR